MRIYGAINMSVMQQKLSADDFKKLEDLLDRIENTVMCQKEVLKRYSGIKSNIKKIEKKMAALSADTPDEPHGLRWIPYEIEKIERKYEGIDKAIKKHRESMANIKRLFKGDFSPPFYAYSGPLHYLGNYVRECEHCIHTAEDSMRITKRYFKNISSHFEGTVRLLKLKAYIKLKALSQPIQNNDGEQPSKDLLQ